MMTQGKKQIRSQWNSWSGKSLEIIRIIRVHSLGTMNVCTEQLLNYFCQSRSLRYILAIGIYDRGNKTVQTIY